MRAIVVLLTLIYPALVYFGLGWTEPRVLAGLLAAVALLRALASKERIWLVAAGGAMLLALASALGNQLMPLKLYPVLVNLIMLTLFAFSLRFPPSMIERLARLKEPDLPPSGVIYTRQVTKVWCGFFVLNGSIALYTALAGNDRLWALYNGAIAYVLMGVLFIGEWLVRQRFKARHAHD